MPSTAFQDFLLAQLLELHARVTAEHLSAIERVKQAQVLSGAAQGELDVIWSNPEELSSNSAGQPSPPGEAEECQPIQLSLALPQAAIAPVQEQQSPSALLVVEDDLLRSRLAEVSLAVADGKPAPVEPPAGLTDGKPQTPIVEGQPQFGKGQWLPLSVPVTRQRSGRSLLALTPSGVSNTSLSSTGRNECQERAAKFELWDLWRQEIESEQAHRRWWASRSRNLSPELRSNASHMSFELVMAETQTRYEKLAAGRCQHIIAHPNCRKRLAWDFMGMAFIGYDIIMIPLLVFQSGSNPLITAMAWALRIYWTLDLPLSFCVGYHQGGLLIMNPVKIAKHYLRTWFALDAFLVTIEWLLVAAGDDEGDASEGMESLGLARLGKTARVVRMLRLFRLLRLIKLPNYFLRLEEHIQSEYAVVVINIMKFTACILVLNHFVACLWYAIGTVEIDSALGDTWVRVLEREKSDWSVGYRYATSLHWSLTQFTPASMEVYPHNLFERLFSVVVLVFALVTFSSFVSSITNAMTHLRNMNSEYAKQLIVFQRYLRAKKISTPLAVRMRRHLEHRLLRAQQSVSEYDVELLKLLSEPLLMELHVEVYMPDLQHHPFFLRYGDKNPTGIRKLCHSAVREIPLSQGDLLFCVGDTSEKMYFVRTGTLEYFMEDGAQYSVEFVREPEWVCEPCLWTPWVHCGEMHAKTRCTLLALEAALFHEVARSCRCMTMRPARYGDALVDHLCDLDQQLLTDLHENGFDYQHAVDGSCEDENSDDQRCPAMTPSPSVASKANTSQLGAFREQAMAKISEGVASMSNALAMTGQMPHSDSKCSL